MDVKERLKKFIKDQGLSVKAFEESINASNGYVNSISKGIGVDKLELIVEKYPNIDIYWLLLGKENNASSKAVQHEDSINSNDPEKMDLLRFKINALEAESKRLEKELKECQEKNFKGVSVPRDA